VTRRARIGWLVAALAAAVAAVLVSPGGPGERLAHRYRLAWREWRLAGRAPEALPPGAALPALDATATWVNGAPLPADSLRGRVVVLALFNDTDPVALAELPRVEAWHEAYMRFGARVVGVHAPAFAFAADPRVPARLAQRLGLTFPIMLDPTLRAQRALGGPARGVRVVVADAGGRVVANGPLAASGPGAPETLLREALRARAPDVLFPAGPAGGAAAPAPAPTVVPLGSGRVTAGPLATAPAGESQTFTAQFRYQEEGLAGVPYPVGRWTPGADGLTAARGGAAQFVSLRYDAPRSGAARVGAVLSPPADGPVRLWVLRDERWLEGAALGGDARLDEHGASYVEVDEPRLYDVARGGGTYKLSPEREGLTVHAITLTPAP
jgi:hypothetical protein